MTHIDGTRAPGTLLLDGATLAKIFLGDWLFDGKVPAAMSLSVTGSLLAGGILYSLWRTRA